MRMRCEKMRKNFVTVVRCEFWLHFRIAFAFGTFSHFCTFFCIFCAFFLHFSQLFGALPVKYRPKTRKKCEKCDANAMRWAFTKSANAMRKSFRTTTGTIPGFPCNSVKQVLVANGNRYEVDSNTFFLISKAHYPYKILSCMDSDLFWHAFASVICASRHRDEFFPYHNNSICCWYNGHPGLKSTRTPKSWKKHLSNKYKECFLILATKFL